MTATRRDEGAVARLAEERHRLRLVVSRRPHRRHAPAQLRDPVALHRVGGLVDVAMDVDLRPGSASYPRRHRRRAARDGLTRARDPAVIRSPSTITTASAIGAAPVPSISRAPTIAVAVCAYPTRADHAMTRQARRGTAAWTAEYTICRHAHHAIVAHGWRVFVAAARMAAQAPAAEIRVHSGRGLQRRATRSRGLLRRKRPERR